MIEKAGSGKFLFALILILMGSGHRLLANCVSLIQGPIALDVTSCGVLNPQLTFDTSNPDYAFIKALPPGPQKQFWNSYRGMLVKGKVVRSFAVRSGLTQQKGALMGEDIQAFIKPGSTPMTCENLRNRRVKTVVDEACCQGGGDPPCLLNTTFVLRDPQVIANITRAKQERQNKKLSPRQRKGNKFFSKKDYKRASISYARAMDYGELNLLGHYKLALSYRRLDRCNKALKPLEVIFRKGVKKDFWQEEEEIVRKGSFLLAKCYAKMNRPGFAVTVLETYLLEPKKYKSEISWSLKHKDFGWIHTSKEYIEYRREAQAALSRMR